MPSRFQAPFRYPEEYLEQYGVHRDAFAAVMLAAGRLACEAAERQLPPEPANTKARPRSYPQLPARTTTHVKILLDHSLDPRFHTDLSEKLCAPAYSAKFLDAHRFENGDMLRPSRPATR